MAHKNKPLISETVVSQVGFSLKKQGETLSDIRTLPNSTVVDNVRTIYGNPIAR